MVNTNALSRVRALAKAGAAYTGLVICGRPLRCKREVGLR